MYATRLVVLAAGLGSRLGHGRGIKPLARLGGITLLERAIVAGHDAGFEEVIVVAGYGGDQVRKHALDVSRRRGLRVTVVHNDRFPEGNGLSVLAARTAVGDEPFAVVMADHVFAAGVLRTLRAEPPRHDGVLVGADPGLGRRTAVDADDATKLCLDGAYVTAIGKDLTSYDAFDVGAFVCGPGVFEAIEKAAAKGAGSWTAAIGELVETRLARVVVLDSDAWWFDVDTPADRRRGDRFLLRGTGKALDGAVAARINRFVSQRIVTPVLLKAFRFVTPNQVTLVAFGVAVAAAVAFAFEAPLAAAILVCAASILDGSDGEVARLTLRSSRFGGFLDAALDRAADGLLFTGAAIFLAVAGPMADLFGDARVPVALLVAGIALVGHLMVSYTTAKAAVDLGHRYRGALVAGGKGRDLRLFIVTSGAVGAALHPIWLLVSLAIVAMLCTSIVVVRLRASRWATGPGACYLGVKGVAFDFDGTLVDSMGHLTQIATGLLSNRLGMSRDEAERRYLATAGDDFRTQLDRLASGHPDLDAMAEAFEAAKDRLMGAVRPFVDAHQAIGRLIRDGLPVLVCSSTRAEIVIEFCQRHRLAQAPTVAVDGWRPGQPKAAQVVSWAKTLEIPVHDVVFVGDARRDAEIAASAGARFVGLARPGRFDAFAGTGLPVVTSLRELAAQVGRAYTGPIEAMVTPISTPSSPVDLDVLT